MKIFSFIALFAVFCFSSFAAEVKSEGKGAAWRGDSETHAAHWRPKEKAQDDYQFHLYRNEGMFVEGPGYAGAGIGMIPGVVVGTVVGIPMIPFENGFTDTVTSSTLFFGKAGSMILGFPFYGLKKIFWDAPKAMVE